MPILCASERVEGVFGADNAAALGWRAAKREPRLGGRIGDNAEATVGGDESERSVGSGSRVICRSGFTVPTQLAYVPLRFAVGRRARAETLNGLSG